MERRFYEGPCVWMGIAILLIPLVMFLSGWEPETQAAVGEVLHGKASWYSTAECKAPTASGERLDDKRRTCAMWGVPFGSRVRITHRGNSVVAVCNDRGPARRLVERGRVIDLSKAAFSALASLDQGVIQVTVEVLK